MGYRSEVSIAIFKSDFDNIVKDAKENCKDGFDLIKYGTIELYKREIEDVIVITWSDIKWYEGYNDIDYIMDSLKHLADIERPYKFIRIGEETGDVEVDENYIDWDKDYSVMDIIYPVTYISGDQDGEVIKLD